MKYCMYFLLSVNILLLGACGVKPSHVEPPAGAKHDDTFPRAYPDINTDPQPGLENKGL